MAILEALAVLERKKRNIDTPTTDTMGVRPWKTRSAQCLLTEKSVGALNLIDLEGEKVARYDLATYECSLGHRSYILREPKTRNSS